MRTQDRGDPMRVHVHCAEDGSSWYRLRFPMQARMSDDVRELPPLDHHAQAMRVERGHALHHNIVDIVYPDLPDVVVVNRPYTRTSYELIRAIQRAGTAVVVDIDDDLHALEPEHPMWYTTRPNWLRESEMRMRANEFSRAGIHEGHSVEVIDTAGHSAGHPEGTWYYIPEAISDEGCQWTSKACAAADLVTVTTPALAERYGRHGRVVVLPNCVPDDYLWIDKVPNGRVTLGWPGTATTHVHDLDVVGSAVAEVCDVTGAAFRAIGGAHTSRSLGVADQQAEFVDWVKLDDFTYARAVASLDVGIVPLIPSKFNDAKSALKMIEFAALGVPCVVSPSPDNLRMHALGIGLVAETPDEWRTHLLALVESAAMREDVAARGREVMRGWTYEVRAHEWIGAWEMAATFRATRRAA